MNGRFFWNVEECWMIIVDCNVIVRRGWGESGAEGGCRGWESGAEGGFRG